MEAARPVRAFGAEAARVADVAGRNEPHARQRDALLRGDALDDPVEHRARLPLPGDADRDGRKRLGSHGRDV